MATYPVKHVKTGETKDVKMSIHDWDQWKKDNPEWERYFTAENSPSFGEVGEVYDKLKKSHPIRNLMSYIRHRKCQVPMFALSDSYASKKKVSVPYRSIWNE